jgi:hypothetical protein
VLALHLVKQGGGGLVVALVQQFLGLQIQRINIARHIGRILGLVALARAARKQRSSDGNARQRNKTGRTGEKAEP